MLIRLLPYFGSGEADAAMDVSYLPIIGGWFASVRHPIGFGTWRSGAAPVTGFMAKEVVVSTMNIIYHVPDLTGRQMDWIHLA